ncbi:TIGR03088 family PEP-CTERM/XrtA system glycosyltransferase [Niveibacterium sp. SC-1]|uniref:TIGR03088 family PEP-CTERM/XrtA system glycosyltransferase n=1 Tax=Niveibacterium sp. SC-1 TaxID=3135646 RepID=UPI00311E18E6
MVDPRPLIAHIVYSFRVGGLENGMVNLINRLPDSHYRHAVIALTAVDPTFAARIKRDDVQYLSLHKSPGQGAKLFPRMHRLLRELSPAIVHTRNLAALEMNAPAWSAGVPVRIHGEHGWDENDPGGRKPLPRWIRKGYRPFVTHYIALSRELENYLAQGVGVAATRRDLICNGVDAQRFRPREGARQALKDAPFTGPGLCVIGTVGRLQAVKDQAGLVQAFAILASRPGCEHVRLVIVGEGPQRAEVEAAVAASGIAEKIWLAGERSDVAELMRSFDVFALPSLAEGISNTVLEAMACGLPVVATAVGGNPELVGDGITGTLVPVSDREALADALQAYVKDAARLRAHGEAARGRIEESFSLDGMVGRYDALYRRMLERAARPKQ